MPRPVKLPPHKLQKLIAELRAGADIPDTATRYGVSTRYLYARRKSLSDEAAKQRSAQHAAAARRGKPLDTARCVNCNASFARWEGEEHRWLCSGVCFLEYADKKFPPKDTAKQPGVLCPPDTHEFQQHILLRAGEFFPECAPECAFEDLSFLEC